MKPLILIVGPTASGKSALALALAREFAGGILNCDSLQTYRRLDIGTAKPPVSERQQVDHFLFDVLSPGEVLTAGDFRRWAMEVLERELPKRPIFAVGGSGFYIQALEKGMFDLPKPNPEIEREVRDEAVRLGPAATYAKLLALDPAYGESISPNDSYRILRALVILAESGQKVSVLKAKFSAIPFPFPLLKLGLAPTRAELEPRVIARTQGMLSAGLLEEVKQLLAEGHAAWPPLQSVGYKECLRVLAGALPLEKLAAAINEKTLQLAKKQKTWFKRDADTHWLPSEDPWPRAREIVLRYLDRGA